MSTGEMGFVAKAALAAGMCLALVLVMATVALVDQMCRRDAEEENEEEEEEEGGAE